MRRVSRRAFLTECLAALPAARVGVLASQVDARRAPRAREPIERIPLGRIGARLRATYRDLPAHFIFEYYPWYGTSPWRHWDEGGRKPPGQIASNYLPALGPYDSLDTRVIEQHANLTALPADNLNFRNISNFFDLIVNLRGNASEHEMIIAVTGESKGQNGNVIDRARFDERMAGTGRD